MRKYLENTGIVFSVSIILGLFLPSFCECASQLITVYLIVAMSLSLRTIPFSKKDIRKNMGPSLKALVVNYVFLSGITLLMAYLPVSYTHLRAHET